MNGRPTVYDVAEAAGVSIATVSFCFSQPGRVRASTREAVLAAASELGYVPSASARGLAVGSTGVFGMYAFDLMLTTASDDDLLTAPPRPDPDPRVFPLYVDEIERGFALECRSRGRALLLAAGAATKADVFDFAGRVDGLAIFPGPLPLNAIHRIADRIPVVAFSEPIQDASLNHVSVDNDAGMWQLVEHLVSAHAVTDMAFVSGMPMNDFQRRRVAFQAARASMVPGALPDSVDRDALVGASWHLALRALINEGRLPEALVCHSDQLAFEVLDILNDAGISVPGDVVVTGFDGVLAGRLSTPTLTTVRQPLEAMGRLAFRLLAEHALDRSLAPEHHQLPVALAVRESCGCAA